MVVDKFTVLWDVTPCICKKKNMLRLHHHEGLQGTFI